MPSKPYTLVVGGKHRGFFDSPLKAIEAGRVIKGHHEAKYGKDNGCMLEIHRETPLGGVERVHEE